MAHTIDNSFFKQDNIDINYLDLLLFYKILNIYLKLLSITLPNGKIVSESSPESQVLNEMRVIHKELMNGIDKGLKRAYNVSYGDTDVKIGEFSNANNTNKEDFSIVIPVSGLVAVPFFAQLNPELESFTDIFLTEKIKKNTYLDHLDTMADRYFSQFYKKLDSFVYLRKYQNAFLGQIKESFNDKIVFYVRII